MDSEEIVDGIGMPVDDGQRPSWTKSAAAFVALNRIAVESRTVSEGVHKLSNGPEASFISKRNVESQRQPGDSPRYQGVFRRRRY